jgi:hypothetical protein
VLADGAGNVYVAGTNFCVFPWDDIQNYQPCVIKAFVRSYDSLGELEWERTLGENESSKSHPGWCEAYDIALDDAGSLFVAGAFYGVVDLAPGSDGDHHLAMNRWDAFLLKTPLPPQ